MKSFLFLILFLISFALPVSAGEETDSLYDALGSEEKEILYEIGIESADYEEFLDLDGKRIFSYLGEKLKEEIKKPFEFVAETVAVLVLYAAFMHFEKSESPLRKTVSLSSVLVCALLLIVPLSQYLERCALVLSSSGKFILSASAVYCALLYMGGNTSFASSYSYISLLAGNVVSFVISSLANPVLSIFLSFSVVSGLSERFSLSKFCDFFYKAIRITLAFSITVFTSVLMIQSAVFSGVDAAVIKTARFAVSSFVPAVGSAISDAVSSVYSSVKLLRSGAGAFGILASVVIFAPTLISYAVWKIMCAFTLFISETFEIKNVSVLLKSAERTLDIMAALLVSCMAVIIIISGIVLSLGKV